MDKKRIIDANDFLNLFYVASAGQDKSFIRTVEMVVSDTPEIDAVEVVRCKDCALYGPSPYGHPTIGWCKMHGTHYKPEFFCGLAERKESC